MSQGQMLNKSLESAFIWTTRHDDELHFAEECREVVMEDRDEEERKGMMYWNVPGKWWRAE